MTNRSVGVHVLAAPDKFRGTASSVDIADAVVSATLATGGIPYAVPLADGGEGTLDAFGGANRWNTVTGPLGSLVRAGWRLEDEQPAEVGRGSFAVIEMAEASGLLAAGGAEGNDPMAATTRGTGELIAAALAAGATEVMVGLGGSATTDGGHGAVEVLTAGDRPSRRALDSGDLGDDSAHASVARCGSWLAQHHSGVTIRVCADVRTRFLDAARVFGPQKGATPGQVVLLTQRLHTLHDDYRQRFGIDVARLERSGAAGGLAGGLAALGATLEDGFSAIARARGLDDALGAMHCSGRAQLVVTGEGRLDRTSLNGKVVGGVIEYAARHRLPVLVVCGIADKDVAVPDNVVVISLLERFGLDAAIGDTTSCVTAAVTEYLRHHAARGI